MNSQRVLRSIIALLALLPLGACGLLARYSTPPAPEARVVLQSAPPSESDQLLSYAGKLRKYEARDAAIDREALRAVAARERTDFARIKYALALSVLAGTGSAEDAEIITTLDPLVASAPAAEVELRTLALLLHGAASERRRLRDQLRELQTRVSQARREETREAETRALRTKVDELEAKLMALKSIDRSVNRRTEPK
jgi:predicted small lipoprotein YifL